MSEGELPGAQRTRNADGRNYYRAPCCSVNIGVLEDLLRVDCPACGARLWQGFDMLEVWPVEKETSAAGGHGEVSELIGRRSFLTGLAAVITAPAIVRASSIMPVRGIIMDAGWADYGRSPAMDAIGALEELQKAVLAPIIKRLQSMQISCLTEGSFAPDQSSYFRGLSVTG